MCDEITYPFPHFNGLNGTAIEIREVISSHALLEMWLRIHTGISDS